MIGPNATLWAVHDGDAAVTVICKPTSGADSATNPAYTGSAVLESFTPMTGSVGDLASASASFQAAGALTRDVTP